MSFKQRNEAYLYKNCKKLMIFIFTLNLFITKIVQNIKYNEITYFYMAYINKLF